MGLPKEGVLVSNRGSSRLDLDQIKWLHKRLGCKSRTPLDLYPAREAALSNRKILHLGSLSLHITHKRALQLRAPRSRSQLRQPNRMADINLIGH